MKRVLQISNYLYPNIGGIEQVARDIANAINDEYEQKIICFNENAIDGDYVCRRNETVYDYVDGIEVIRCGCQTKVASQSLSLSYAGELKKIMNNFNPDVVVFHYPNPFVSTLLMPYLKRKLKLVVYWHLDIVKQKLLGKLFKRQSMKLLKRANAIVPTSPNYIEGSPFLSKFREKCRVIPNCINPDRLDISDEIRNRIIEIREQNRDKVICFACGRHVPYKGITYLVQASKLLDDRFAIYIGGKGPLTEELQREAGDDKKIHFLGRVGDEDLVAYMAAMDIFCFPSITKNEAFGIALAEGMYFEKPAVTFTIPGSGVNYVSVSNETGIEVPNGDVKAYAEALMRLADDESLRNKYGKAAKKRVEEMFMKDTFSENNKELLRNLVGE